MKKIMHNKENLPKDILDLIVTEKEDDYKKAVFKLMDLKNLKLKEARKIIDTTMFLNYIPLIKIEMKDIYYNDPVMQERYEDLLTHGHDRNRAINKINAIFGAYDMCNYNGNKDLVINDEILELLKKASDNLCGFLDHYVIDEQMGKDSVQIEDPLNKAIKMIKGESI